MKRISILFVICIVLSSVLLVSGLFAFAPSTTTSPPKFTKPIVLSLKDAVLLALRYNPALQVADLDRVVQKYGVVVAKNEFMPQYKLTSSWGTSTAVSDGMGTRTETTNAQPSIGLKTKIGTNFNLAMDNTKTNTGGYSPSLTLSVTQPLLKGFGYDIVTADLKGALDTEEVNKLNLKSSTIDTLDAAVADYLSVVQAEQTLDVDNDSLARTKKTIKQDRLRIKLGEMARNDIMQALSQQSSQEQSIKVDANALSQARLKLLDDLGLSNSAKIIIPKKIDYNGVIKQFIGNTLPGEGACQKFALDNNINYLVEGYTLKSVKRELAVAKNDQFWDLELSAGYTKSSPGRAISGLKGGLNKNYNVGLDLTVPIDDVHAKYDLISAKVGLQQADINYKEQKRQLLNDVINQRNTVLNSMAQVEDAKRTVSLQKKTLQVAQTKYSAGMISSFELLEQQKELQTQEQNIINTMVSYIDALISLDQKLGVTLDRWAITMNY